jgi:hypothetical protein
MIKFYGFAAPEIDGSVQLSYAFEYMENGSLDDLLVDISLGIERPPSVRRSA